MRDIKFRAWDGKRMHDQPQTYVSDTGSINDAILNWKLAGDVLMQYTGLKDVSGQEIFEGDILEADGFKRVVVYRDPSFYLAPNLEEDYGLFPFSTPIAVERIIGNVYENPDLLKAGDA